MKNIAATLRREARVAFSLRTQPLWFRIVKWVVAIWFIARFHQRAWFGFVVGVVLLLAISLHVLYRRKTRAWTRAWGGWNDLAAGRGRDPA